MLVKNCRNEIILDTPINEGSVRSYTLMGEDYVTLKISTPAPVNFSMGDYIQLPDFGRFELVDLPKPNFDNSSEAYEYEVKFEAPYKKWRNKLFKFYPAAGGGEASWSLTAPLFQHLDLILGNLKALGIIDNENDIEYGYLIDPDVSGEAKLMTYNNTSILDALGALAQEWETEYWIEGNIIRFGKCLNTALLKVELDLRTNLESMGNSSAKTEYATRIYAFGSTRNIPPKYRKKLVFTAAETGNLLWDIQRPLRADFFDKTTQNIQSTADPDAPVSKGGIKVVAVDGYFIASDGSHVTFLDGCVFNPILSTDIDKKIQLPSGYHVNAGTFYCVPQVEDNAPSSYFSPDVSPLATVEGIVEQRLMLPVDTPYVDIKENQSVDEVVEKVVVFEEIYPRMELHVTDMEKKESTYTDDEGGRHTDIFYRIKDNSFKFDRDWQLDGEELHVIFQSGLLNGMEFEAHFNPDGLDPSDPNSQWFEITVNETYGRTLPDTILCPSTETDNTIFDDDKKGDKFFLVNWDSTKMANTGLIEAAERELLEKTQKYIKESSIDPSSYPCELLSDFAFNSGLEVSGEYHFNFRVGQPVKLINPAYFKEGYRESRIMGFECPLDIPYDKPTLTIGDKPTYSRFGELKESVENLTTRINSLQSTGGGSAIKVIRTGEVIPATDFNVYSALRSSREFLSKTRSDSTPYSINAKQGFTAGDFITGASGAAVDGRGNAEVESIVVRSFMKVFELVYNRLNALEGNTSFADSGTIESITDNGDSTYTAVMRKRWEGDFTSFQVGDVVYGYVNDLRKEAPEGYVYSEDTENTGNTESPKEGGYVYYKAWAYVSEVDRASNTLTLVRYADTDTPANKNFPMRADMLISRWGNNVTPCEEAASDENHKSFIVNRNGKWINTRQQSFYISCDDGNIVELCKVSQPILTADNYGTVLGQISPSLAQHLGISDYVNFEQPYLYARGIIVQDLIRISYNGAKLRTPNFRYTDPSQTSIEWQPATAESDTDHYRRTDDSEDWVTYRGALYHYISDERTTLSPEEDNGVHWGKITGTLKPVWQIVPSVDKINIRDNGWSDKTIEVVVRATEITGVTDITTPEALDAYGKELVFSLDGVTYNEFWVRQGEGIDGTGLDRGGNNIPWMEVTDRILLTLRNKETHDEAMTVSVPVIKDGAKGENGESIKGADGTSVEMRYRIFDGFPDPSDVADLLDKGQRHPDGWKTTHSLAKAGESLWCITATIDGDNSLVGEWNDPTLMTGKEGGEGKNGKAGPMAYPAGAYKTEVEYEGRYGTLPVVLDGEVYYILKEGKTWCGADKPATRNYPHLDYNINDTETCWQMFDMFNTIFAKILMADHALLGDAVFWGQYMFSQWGKDASGNDTDRYSSFDGLATDTFTPNLLIDFLTGMLRCNNVELTGTINANGGRIGNLQIRGNSLVGLDENDDEVVRLGVGEVDLRETNATIGVRMGIKAMDAHPGITCGNTTDYACWAQTEAYCTPTSGNKMDLHATLTFTLGEDVETLKIERMGGSHTTGGGTYFGQPAISAILYRVQSGSRTATGATWDATDTKTFSGLAAGSYEVDVTVSFPALPSGQSWWGTIRLDTGIITATTARELGNLMEMARDGFLCRQGANKYLQFSKSEGFEVRFGSFGLKIDSDGIKGIKDNEWRKINFQYS